jgi:hypothetical protein
MHIFGPENLKERDHSVDPGVDGKVILNRIIGCRCIHPSRNRNQWRAFVNTVMKLGV